MGTLEEDLLVFRSSDRLSTGPLYARESHPGFPDGGEHAADRPFNVVKEFAPDLRLSDFAGPIPLPAESVAAAEDVRRAIGTGRRLLIVHEETASEDKRWLPSRMQETLRALTAEDPDLFAIIVGRGAPSFALEPLGDSATAITHVGLPLFMALIARADVFIGVDSLGIHVADLWGVPSVGLFGPTKPEEWGLASAIEVCTWTAEAACATSR